MKLSQRELEFKILYCLFNYDNAVYMATERSIESYHFQSKEPGTEVSLTGNLYKLALEYCKDSGGHKLTETVLESMMLKKNKKPSTQAKYLNLWDEISEEEANYDDLPHLLQLLKDRYCVKLQSEMVDKLADYVEKDQIKESINTMTDYLNAMHEEQDEFKKDKVAFDMSEAEEFFFKEYDERLENFEAYQGIHCGLSNIDQQTFGFLPAQLVVLLAPSSGGKSVQLLNWADYAHRVCKKNVLYFSFEMSSWLCKLRHASLIGEIDYSKMKATRISAEERQKLASRFSEIANGKYFEYMEAIEDPTPEFIEQKIREITLQKGKPDLIVADYIGNMTTRSTSKNAKHWEKNGDAAEGLFKLAKRYGVPVLTAQQINRDSIKENRKRKEDGKAAAFYQDAASGDQRLIHLATYVIGMEPNKEDSVCWYHPVKMRDAWFAPFAAKWIPEYNKVVELTDSQQAALSIIKSADTQAEEKVRIQPKTYEVYETDLSNWAEDF